MTKTTAAHPRDDGAGAMVHGGDDLRGHLGDAGRDGLALRRHHHHAVAYLAARSHPIVAAWQTRHAINVSDNAKCKTIPILQRAR